METPEKPTQTLRRLHDNTDGLLRALMTQVDQAQKQVLEANHPYEKELVAYLVEVKFQLLKARGACDLKAHDEAVKIYRKSKKVKGDLK